MNPGHAAPQPATNAVHWLEGKIAYSVGFGVIVLLLIGAGLLYYSQTTQPPTEVVRIAYGAGAPVRRRFLDQMALHGRKQNLDIRLVPTEGTDQTLSLIDRGDAELGLIAGVVEDRGSRRVLEVTPLYMEPLHLLVRAPLYEAVVQDFGQLKGRTIDLDSQNSSTNLLATELLRFIGLTDPVTGRPQYQPVYVSQLRLAQQSETELPDAVFQIGGVPSATIHNLIVNHGYRLVPLPFGESFNLGKFRESEAPDLATNPNLRLNKSFVEEAVIPAFVYSVLPAVPPADTRTVATRLVLVGSERLSNQTVRRVLEDVFGPDVSNFSKPALNVALLNSSFPFERHPGTDAYLNSLKPFDVDGAFSTYGRLGEVWGLIIALYLAGSRGLKMLAERRARTQKKSVGDFVGEILAVEAAATASCTHQERVALDQRLSDIKKSALELHLAERLDGSDNFPSLLATLADARTRIWGTAPPT